MSLSHQSFSRMGFPERMTFMPNNISCDVLCCRGIEDLIVGAPYDGEGHAGAVYIYMGGEEGITKKPAQRIAASEVGANLRTFGWSISAGMDLDKNLYPDLLVGAYESGNAVYLKSAPVVQVNCNLV